MVYLDIHPFIRDHFVHTMQQVKKKSKKKIVAYTNIIFTRERGGGETMRERTGKCVEGMGEANGHFTSISANIIN